jgi:hypothetical protein
LLGSIDVEPIELLKARKVAVGARGGLAAISVEQVLARAPDVSATLGLGVISMLGLDSTPVVPMITADQKPFPMLADVLRKTWCTKLITYEDLADLTANLDERVVKVAEAKVQELRGTKAE